MDYRYYNGQSEPLHNPKGDSLSIVSLILGICSIPTSFFIYPGLMLGATAIVLALLSRGRERLDSRARAGIVCGCIALILTITLICTAVYMLLSTPGLFDGLMEQYGYEITW